MLEARHAAQRRGLAAAGRATQLSVVVLPQREGPRSTTISPPGTAKLTPSIAGRPTENCLRRLETSRVAVMIPLPSLSSLPIAVCFVPVGDPLLVQFHILIEIGIPDLGNFRIEAFGIDRSHLKRSEIPDILDHEGLPFL